MKKRDGHKLCEKSCAELSFDRFFVHRLGNSKYWPFPTYEHMGSCTNTISRKNTMVIKFARSSTQSRFSIDFSCTFSEIQNTGHSRRISPLVEFRSVFLASSWKFKILAIPNVLANVTRRVEFRSIFRAPSQKFKILAIPDVLAHGKSYEHGFAKKRDGHKLCAKSRAGSSFDRFLVHRLGN
ncbi:hypothetical protein GW17_00059678 [Ensete ventricosum]|nr:hypothetical protein GW17_00059678 [Ensete ventricosum]